MASVRRLLDIGTERGERWLSETGAEFRHSRLRLGLSQQAVADAARVNRATYSLLERGKLPSLSIVDACRIGSVLGLDVSLKAFPGGRALRDGGQGRRLRLLLSCVGRPLRYRVEASLPARADGFEQRAWDVELLGHGERTTIEFEARLYDVQAQRRRIALKLRDDPPDHFLLVVADTRSNRRLHREYIDYFSDLPLLRTSEVLGQLRRGQHPPTGMVFLAAPREK